MQKAEIILSLIKEKSSDKNYIYNRLYRILYNKSFYKSGENKYYKIIDTIKFERYRNIEEDPSSYREVFVTLIKILNLIYVNDKAVCLFKYFYDRDDVVLYVKSILSKYENVITFDFNARKMEIILSNILKKRINDRRFINIFFRLLNVDNLYKEFEAELLKVLFCIFFSGLINDSKLNNILFIGYENKFICLSKNAQYLKEVFDYINYNDIEKVMNVSCKKSCDKNLNIFGFNIYYVNRLKKVKVLIPNNVFEKSIKLFTKNNKPSYVSTYVNLPLEDIINKYTYIYKNEFRDFTIADNYKYIKKKYKYFMYSSLLRTIARKENTSVKKIYNKYMIKINNCFNN